MANVTTTFRGTPSLSTTPKIYNLAMANANQEYSQALTNHTKKFTIRCRIPAVVKLAFISGDSLLNFLTLSPGNSYSEENLDLENVIIYANSSVAGNILEIMEWT